MSTTGETEFEITKAVCDAFGAAMPEGLPEGIVVVQGINSADKVRPGITVKAENGTWIHPRLYQGDVVMVLAARVEDVPDEAAFATWAAVMEKGLLQRGLVIKAALETQGLRMMHLMIQQTAAAPDEEDGYVAERRWQIRVRVL